MKRGCRREGATPKDPVEIAAIKGMLARGDNIHDIAAYYGMNSARIADVKSGKNKTAVGVTAAPVDDRLPPAGPYPAVREYMLAKNTLVLLRDQIADCLAVIERFRPTRTG